MNPDIDMEALIQWQSLVEEALVGYKKIQVADVLAIIWLESAGKPTSVNKKSLATGLMQVMPQEAGDMFSDRPTSEDLKDPTTNIPWGVKILAYYYAKEGGMWGALYRYSGGKTWPSLGDFARTYWEPFMTARDQIQKALDTIEGA